MLSPARCVNAHTVVASVQRSELFGSFRLFYCFFLSAELFKQLHGNVEKAGLRVANDLILSENNLYTEQNCQNDRLDNMRLYAGKSV